MPAAPPASGAFRYVAVFRAVAILWHDPAPPLRGRRRAIGERVNDGPMDLDLKEIPGLVWAYRFDTEGRAHPLVSGSHEEAVVPQSGFLWLHLSVTDIRLPGFLERLGLPEEARRSLVLRDRHAVLRTSSGVVHGVLPGYETDFEHTDETTAPIGRFHLAAGDHYIVTTRPKPLRSFASVRAALDRGQRFQRPAALLAALMDAFHREAGDMVARLTDAIDTIEDGVFDARLHDERRQLGLIRRRLVIAHRNLRSASNLVEEPEEDMAHDLPSGMTAVLDRLAHQMEALDVDICALQDRARLVQEEISAQLSWEMNRLLFLLSIISGLLLPPTLVTGFFGMNTRDLPFEDVAHGTLLAACIGVAAALFVAGLMWRFGMLYFGRRR